VKADARLIRDAHAQRLIRDAQRLIRDAQSALGRPAASQCARIFEIMLGRAVGSTRRGLMSSALSGSQCVTAPL